MNENIPAWRNSKQYQWYQKNRKLQTKKMLAYQRKRKYGITETEYHGLLDKQNNLCAICMFPFSDSRAPDIDHDHRTGRVRGILCRKCNLGIGRLRENITTMSRALAYIARNGN